jgi:protein-S-isoprenylcysteine O-methyltransferase Ste14
LQSGIEFLKYNGTVAFKQNKMKWLEDWGWSPTWWKGDRGEYWFFGQVLLLLIFVLIPVQRFFRLDDAALWFKVLLWTGAGLLWLGGTLLLLSGLLDLGRSLTPLPYPRRDGQLVEDGIYGIVRHPLYSGLILLTLAWIVFSLSWSHLLCAIALAILLNAKTTQEEQWLLEKYPGYASYRQRVKKFIPGLY